MTIIIIMAVNSITYTHTIYHGLLLKSQNFHFFWWPGFSIIIYDLTIHAACSLETKFGIQNVTSGCFQEFYKHLDHQIIHAIIIKYVRSL